MAKDISKILLKINDEAEWRSVIAQSDTKLVVVDVHQDWCGLCEAIHPTVLRIFTEYDNAEQRIVFSSANIAKLGPVIQASFPSDTHVNLEKNGCIPIFALYRFKTCVSVIVGVDGPLLLQQISINVPDKVSKEEA